MDSADSFTKKQTPLLPVIYKGYFTFTKQSFITRPLKVCQTVIRWLKVMNEGKPKWCTFTLFLKKNSSSLEECLYNHFFFLSFQTIFFLYTFNQLPVRHTQTQLFQINSRFLRREETFLKIFLMFHLLHHAKNERQVFPRYEVIKIIIIKKLL